MNQLDHWRKIALEEMRVVLKPHGFKKTGINFHKRMPEAWFVLNLQSSSWNSGNRPMVVYGNIGLFYTAVEENLRNPKQGPPERLCHWRARVPGNQGQASKITSDEEARMCGYAFARNGWVILQEVLRRYPTPASMLEAHRKNKQVDHDLSRWAHFWGGLIVDSETAVKEEDGVS